MSSTRSASSSIIIYFYPPLPLSKSRAPYAFYLTTGTFSFLPQALVPPKSQRRVPTQVVEKAFISPSRAQVGNISHEEPNIPRTTIIAGKVPSSSMTYRWRTLTGLYHLRRPNNFPPPRFEGLRVVRVPMSNYRYIHTVSVLVRDIRSYSRPTFGSTPPVPVPGDGAQPPPASLTRSPPQQTGNNSEGNYFGHSARQMPGLSSSSCQRKHQNTNKQPATKPTRDRRIPPPTGIEACSPWRRHPTCHHLFFSGRVSGLCQ